MANLVDFLLDTYEDDDLFRVAGAVRDGRADDRLVRMWDGWHQWAEQFEQPPLAKGALRPFAYATWGNNVLPSGLAAAWARGVGRFSGAASLHQQLLRHLLYCDSVALPDPFMRSMEGGTSEPRIDGMLSTFETRRAWAAEAIDFVAYHADLITAGHVVIVPHPVSVGSGLHKNLRAAVKEKSELEGLFPPLPDDWWGMSRPEVAAYDLATQLSSANGAFEPYLPTRGHLEVFLAVHHRADAVLRQLVGKPQPEHRLLPIALRCKVPEVIDLTIQDLGAIREGGEFEEWRQAVVFALEHVEEQAKRLEGWPGGEDAGLEDLADHLQATADEQRKSLGWMDRPRVEIAFELALAGLAGASAFAAPPVAAGLGAAGGFGPLARMFKRWRFSRGQFARHVAVFGSEAS